MKISSSIELIWNLAAQEAIAGRFKEIEPEHFCIAILKFSELPLQEVKDASAEAPEVRQVSEEVHAIRTELEGQHLDTTSARRRLRAVIGTGGQPYEGGQIHRSRASREVFDAAAMLADTTGGEVLMVRHLWTALLAKPTEAILRVVGNAASGEMARPASTPLLNEWGRDLIRLAIDGKARGGTDRLSEAKALVRALARGSGKSVLLVADDGDAAMRILTSVAQMMTMRDCPTALKGRRLLEVPSIIAQGEESPQPLERLEQLLFEASRNRVILVLSLSTRDTDYRIHREFVELVRSTIAEGKVQCVWCVSRATYESLSESDIVRRRKTEVIWVAEKEIRGIPNEL